MELAEIRPFEPQMAEIDLFTMPDAVGVGEPSVRKQKPYIAGHVTDGSSTFTFTVNGSDVTVSVSGGDWKYKPTATITSLAFVGVPQLETLELNKIVGVSTFNLDYPVVPVFKGCDATTENALNYVYHIRGTATDDFDFTLKYIDDNNTVTTVTESAVIDGNGNWDISYSGKKIYSLREAFYNNNKITSIECTEPFDKTTDINSVFRDAVNLKSANFLNALFSNATNAIFFFYGCTNLENIYLEKATFERLTAAGSLYRCPSITSVMLPNATFAATTDIAYMFNNCTELTIISIPKAKFDKVLTMQTFLAGAKKLETLNLPSATLNNVNNNSNAFNNTQELKNVIIPSSSTYPFAINLSSSPLTYESMLNIANLIKDYSEDPYVKLGTQSQNNWYDKTIDWYEYVNGEYVVATTYSSSAIYYKLETQTVTFRASTYNALTAEQKAALTAIIVTQKGWNLATA